MMAWILDYDVLLQACSKSDACRLPPQDLPAPSRPRRANVLDTIYPASGFEHRW